jgi:DNA-binding MarR family transcriptional regulator
MSASNDTTVPAPRELPAAALAAWRRFLLAHAVLSRSLDADLQVQHSLTLNDYDVLVQLRDAPDGALRMSEVADRVLLTRSGITRLVDGLQRDGMVERTSCPNDARSVYARITDEGRARLAAASDTHRKGITDVFAGHYTDAELEVLAELLERLLVGVSEECLGNAKQPEAEAPGC